MANITQQAPMQSPRSPFDPAIDLDIKRRRKLADALMKQGEQQQGTEMVSGVAVKQSPLAALAKALTQGVAGYEEGQANSQEADLQSNRNKMFSDAIGQVGKNPNSAASLLAQDPSTAPAGMQIALEMMKDKKAMELAQFKAAHGGEAGQVAASIQVANEIDKALKAGNYQRANILAQSQKMYDKGVNGFTAEGGAAPIVNYTPTVSGIEGGKAGAKEQAQKDVDLTMNPQIANQTAAQTEVGKAQGEAQAALNAQTAQFPQLVAVADKLSKLGKTATYTGAGQAANFVKRQAGLPVGQGATDRAAYIATVDNEVLPLLRQTFGAAFTQKEGESLKVTLGDPNKSPEEKDAVLKAFIQQKSATLQSLSRQTGAEPLPNQTPQAPQKFPIAVNPSTGEKLINRGNGWEPMQ